MPAKNIPNRKNGVNGSAGAKTPEDTVSDTKTPGDNASGAETQAQAATGGRGSPQTTKPGRFFGSPWDRRGGIKDPSAGPDWDLQEMIDTIRAGETVHHGYTEPVSFLETVKEVRAGNERVKRTLPYWCLSGTFTKRGRDWLIEHSGLLQGDLDPEDKGAWTEEHQRKLMEALAKECPYALVIAAGPSGCGAKLIFFRPDLVGLTGDEALEAHDEFFRAVKAYMDGTFGERFGVTFDKQCSDVSRAFFATWDPDLIDRRETAKPIDSKFIAKWVPTSITAESEQEDLKPSKDAAAAVAEVHDSTIESSSPPRLTIPTTILEALTHLPETRKRILKILTKHGLKEDGEDGEGKNKGLSMMRPPSMSSTGDKGWGPKAVKILPSGWLLCRSAGAANHFSALVEDRFVGSTGGGTTISVGGLILAEEFGGDWEAFVSDVEQRTGRSFPRRSGAEERDDSSAEQQQAPEQRRSEGYSSSQKYPQSLTYRQAREDEWYVALRDGREMLQSASWRRRSEEEEKDGLPRREADYMAAMEEDPFSLLITPKTYIPPVRPLIEVVDAEGNDQRVANGGDMVALTGIPGSGKTSAAVAAISGALNPDSKEIGWGWKVHNPEDGAVIVFDTEQPTYAVRDRLKEIEGLTGGRTPYIWAIRGVSAHQRLRALCMAIAAVAEKHEGRIHTIVIDGVTDLAPTVNDEVMAKELVEFLGIVADELGCALLGVVHQNKQGQDPSPRGHIGQEFQRKSASVLGVTQVKGDSTHSVKCLHSPVGKLRHGILPYDLGPKAKYCKEAGRFVELDGELAKQLEESKDSAWDRVAGVFSDNPNGRVTQTEASSVYHDKGLRKTPSSAKKAVSEDFGRMVNEGIMAKEEDKSKGAQYWLTPDGFARLREEKGEEDMGVESPW